MQQAKLSPDLFEQPNTTIPVELAYRFVEIAIQQEDLPHLGLMLALKTPLTAFGYYGQLMQESRTVYEFLNKGVSLQKMQNSSTCYWMTEHENELQFHCRSAGHHAAGIHQSDILTLMIAINQLRCSTDNVWSPRVLSLAQAGKKLPDIELFENTQILMGTGDSFFTLPRTLLEQPFKPLIASQAPINTPKTKEIPDDLPGALRIAIETLLPSGSPNIQMVSEIVGVSAKTLERRLGKLHLTYSKILADTRMNLASKWLGDDSMSIKYIAYSLGYLDPSNFSRAFRRYTGIAPLAYRLNLKKRSYPN